MVIAIFQLLCYTSIKLSCGGVCAIRKVVEDCLREVCAKCNVCFREYNSLSSSFTLTIEVHS